MPTPRKAGRFGGSAAHHNRMMANLATELIRHGRIRTTHAKAKAVQPIAERMITFGKRGDLHARREAGKVVRDGDVLHHLFAEVGPAFAARDGGYTRVLKLGPRGGDAAPMALLELVEDVGGSGGGGASTEDAGRRRWGLRRRGGQAAPAAPASTATAAPEAPAAPAAPTPTTRDEDAIPEPVEADEGTEAEAPEVDPADVETRLADEDAEEASQEDDAASDEDETRD
ncbi:MAG: 50S ribosomal protein L17 [Actinomycetota bacterium]